MPELSLSTTIEQLMPYYGNGVIHLSRIRLGRSSKSFLLFAVVELLPNELPPPPREAVDDLALSDATLRVERFVVTAHEALEWYIHVRAGRASVPMANGETLWLADAVGEEPAWPELALLSKNVPFGPCSWYCARIHHLLPTGGARNIPWPSEQTRARAFEFVSERFHFDLASYSEYLQSVTLSALNPVLRSVHQRVERRPDDVDEVVVRLETRNQVAETMLPVVFEEQRVTTVRRRLVHVPPNTDHTVRVVGGVERFGLSVLHEDLGALYTQQPYHFIRSFSMRMDTSPAPRRVEVDGEAFEVPQRSSRKQEELVPTTGAQSISKGVDARKRLRARLGAAQHAATERRAAQHFVRQRIQGANSRVIIVDPYFREGVVEAFVLSTGTSTVEVRVLASALGFQSPTGLTTAETRRAQAQRVAETIRNLPDQGYVNHVSIRIMLGRKLPVFHDRFLVCDDEIWSLGGSLCDLGRRFSLIQRVADPNPVVEHIGAAWEAGTELEAWSPDDSDG